MFASMRSRRKRPRLGASSRLTRVRAHPRRRRIADDEEKKIPR